MPMEATMAPFRVPMAVAKIREMITATHMFMPMFTIIYAQMTLTKVMMEPMERSIPAIRITKVIPMEAIP